MPKTGDLLAGRYRLDAPIGSGGFATVFRARDLRLQRDVALKVLLANHATDPVVAERFDHEARVLAAIDHPNVVAIHDVEPADLATGAGPFLVMDLCDGGSLADRLGGSATHAVPPDELVPILVDVAEGLDALHARGIVHRDLKPSNVLLTSGRARVADLGIAADGPSELTATGAIVGTIAYLAPEQLAGQPASPASDVHALGVIAFLGLTGHLPRPAGSLNEVVAAGVRPVVSVSVLNPDVGPAFDPAIARALDADPARRPTAAEFGTALSEALARSRPQPGSRASEDVTTLAALPLGGDAAESTAAASSGGRDRRLLVVGVVVAGLVLATMALMILRSGSSADRSSPSPAASGTGISPSPSASTRTTPTPVPSPTPTASPVPTASTDPYADARAASTAMRAAVASARGKGGLKGGEVKDLEGGLDAFDRSIASGDVRGARSEVQRLATQVGALIDQHAVDAQVGSALRAAVDALIAAAFAIPA